MQAIFRMGIPVTGKNVFPSNIQGLPTWYEIRVSKDAYTARAADVDLVVALNTATYAKDVAVVRQGGYLLYDSSWPLDSLVREDPILGIPFGKMRRVLQGDRERTLLRNIAYVGALAAMPRSTWTSLARCSARSSRKASASTRISRHPLGSTRKRHYTVLHLGRMDDEGQRPIGRQLCLPHSRG
jgi:hypothetical protein